MVASKENKIYTITEMEKEDYIKQGYDIYNDDGEILAYGRGKTVLYTDYIKLKEDYEKLEKELKELKKKLAKAEKEDKKDDKVGDK